MPGAQWVGTPGASASQSIQIDLSAPPAATLIAYTESGDVDSVTVDGITTTYTYNLDGTVATDTRLGKTRQYTYDAGDLVSIEEIA
jgi:YD repeat-containing protein